MITIIVYTVRMAVLSLLTSLLLVALACCWIFRKQDSAATSPKI